MADWGALLTTENGSPFITPQSIPLALYSKKTVNVASNSGAIITETFSAGRPIIPFVISTVPCISSYVASGSTCSVTVTSFPSSGTVTVYFFTIFPQPLPDWGIAIWDENGTCILTNETRVLTDVAAIGTSGSDASGGYNINTTRSGKWGIVPSLCGLVTGIIGTSQPRPYMAQYSFCAIWNGSSTNIKSHVSQQPDGAVSGTAYHNMRNRVYALNLQGYD